jgi:hypothetical protein
LRFEQQCERLANTTSGTENGNFHPELLIKVGQRYAENPSGYEFNQLLRR